MNSKFIYWCAFITLVFLCLPVTALAADNPVGVAYRGHIRDVGDYPSDGSWVDSPAIIGTEGLSKRIEGFEIKLTGTIPEGMEMRYNVHIQNKGWLYDENDSAEWPKDGDYAGTRGESLRIEAVKIVLTDSDGKPVSGYSVHYRGHVQNVGDLPADKSQWIADGDQLGTVGSSQRLEALLVQVVKTVVEPVVYDTAGTYGPETGTQVINGDVIVKADGIKLRNLHINGDLYIGEEPVAEKIEKSLDETINADQIQILTKTELQNLSIVSHIQMAAGTGVSITGSPWRAFSISLPGGTQFTATTPGGGVGTGAPMQITASSSAGSPNGVSLGGSFGSLSLLTPGTQVSLSAGCQVQLLSVLMGAPNCGVITSPTALIQDLVVQGANATFGGPGPIQHADIRADWASFATRPGAFTVAPEVAAPPSMPAPPSGGGSGYTPTQSQPVISPSGAVAFPTTVTISSQGADAIYYTTDGSNPTTAGAQNTTKVVGASAEISVTSNITLKAIATRSGYYDSAIASANCTVPVSTNNFTRTAVSDNTVTFSWLAQTGASLVKVQQKPTGGTSWSDSTATASLDGNSTTATITGLTSLTAYDFRLLVTGGATPGISNTVSVTTTRSVTGVSVSPTTATVIVGATTNLGATVAPSDATNQTIVWSSGKEAVATVNENGVVTGMTAGEAIITATTSNNLQASCTVTVKPIFEITETGNQVTLTKYNGTSENVVIPASITSIGASAFKDCGFIKTVTFADTTTLTSIGESAFQGCTSLESMVIPNTAKSIGKSAFMQCKLSNLTFASGSLLESIGETAFLQCTGLTAVIIPNSVKQIDGATFAYCSALKTVTFEAGTNKELSLADNVFNGCAQLEMVGFPADTNLKTLSSGNFYGCSSLGSMTIPASVSSINGKAFAGCKSGLVLTFDGNAPSILADSIPSETTIWRYGNSTEFDAGNWLLGTYIFKVRDVTDTDISSVAAPFTGESPVILIPEDDQYTGSVSWKDGDSNTVGINDKFDGTKVYTATITLNAKPSYGFTGSPAFTVAGADSVTQTIDNNKKLATITAVYSVKDQFRITNGMLTAYSGPGDVVSIPDTVTAIGANTFKENQTLKGVTIPASITSIGTSAFYNCPLLETVTLIGTSTLETIGASAFEGCKKLSAFALPDSLKSIDTNAFKGCENLSTIAIPKNVETIGASAFYYCPKLASVTFAADSLLETIGDSAFKGCFILSTIVIPKNVTIIDKNAFDSCLNLTSVTFAEDSQLTTINESAFFACPLTTITNIPAGVTISAASQTMGTNNSAGFITAYNKIGGTYTYDPDLPTWKKQ